MVLLALTLYCSPVVLLALTSLYPTTLWVELIKDQWLDLLIHTYIQLHFYFLLLLLLTKVKIIHL